MSDNWAKISRITSSLVRSKLLWISVPIASPIIYTIWLNYSLSKTTQSTSGPYGSGKLESSSQVPEEAPVNDPQTLVFHEKVLRSVRKSTLSKQFRHDLDLLLTTYARGNMLVFARLPQAIMMRRLMSDPHDRATFDALHLDGLDFVQGDVACGIYKVVRRQSGSRIEFLMNAPESYRGSAFNGMMIVGIDERDSNDEVEFFNEVWMWRKENEPKVPIEGMIGKKLHLLFVKWLVDKQIRNLSA